MKVILLAGGFGTRLSEYTDAIPKPMVQIGNKPILWHIMNFYAQYNHKNFYVALGYKGEVIREYFSKISEKWNINFIDTGQKTMTGGRVKRLQKFIGKETCMLTYGDGLANINIDNLLSFHKNHGKLVTVSAVRPPGRFGAIKLNDDRVVDFNIVLGKELFHAKRDPVRLFHEQGFRISDGNPYIFFMVYFLREDPNWNSRKRRLAAQLNQQFADIWFVDCIADQDEFNV